MLEASGYKTLVVEFIDLEHTTRNLLIRAMRRGGNQTAGTADIQTAASARTAAGQFAAQLGISQPALDALLQT